jgi:alkylation response protein AidB-like acyl-CoA dehydrogenase
MRDFFLKGVSLNEDEKLLLKMVQDLCKKELAPRAAMFDKEERFPWENVKRINEIGLNGLFIPEAYGGNPVSKTAWLVIMKEISKACPSTGIILATTSHCAYPIAKFGTQRQKEKFLPRFMEGALGAISMTESHAGSDVKSMKSTATRTSEGYVLNGTKSFVTTGDVADLLTIFVKLKEEGDIRGLSPFVVTKEMAGFSTGKKEEKMGVRASSTAEVILDSVHVSEDHLIGEPGEGFKILLDYLNDSRPNIAAQAVGVAEAAFEAAVSYANQRIQFGKRILSHQGIQFMIADMATQIQAAWQLVLHVAKLIDQGHPDFSAESSMAKLMASEVAEKVASDAIQIHGGYGYCRDYPVERIFRDSKITQIYEGTSQIQKIVIGRHFTEKA